MPNGDPLHAGLLRRSWAHGQMPWFYDVVRSAFAAGSRYLCSGGNLVRTYFSADKRENRRREWSCRTIQAYST